MNWEDPDERVLPASRVLRSLPWGRVVRVPGPDPRTAKLRGGESMTPVPQFSATASGLAALGGTMLWAFSFRSPEEAARTIAGLAHRERQRVGLASEE